MSASLSVAGLNFTLPVDGAFSLPPAAGGSEEWAEQWLQALHGSGRRVAWLPREGGLVSNLSLMENCLLPLQWQERLNHQELEARVVAGLDLLGLAAEDAAWLHKRPAQATARERQLALYLRVLLLRPEVVIFAAGALQGDYSGEKLTQVWPRWLPQSLLLYAGAAGSWPVLIHENFSEAPA